MAHARRRYWHYLLDLDPDLAGELDVRMRFAARPAATAVTFELEPGQIDLTGALASTPGGPGLLVLAGALVGYARVVDRVVAELLGRGDLVQSGGGDEDEFIGCDVSWRALEPVRFAILDAEFADRVRPWPQITQVLLHRAERRVHSLAVQRGIAAQPRLEVRLLLLLWHLAARWGKVEPGGVRLPLPLTHLLLGRLVGAERPSVTHALKRLAGAGLVSGCDDGWHLHGSIAEHLDALGERTGEAVRHLLPASLVQAAR
ncbi:MAG TPA: helix-turn-helix domain-containing protein [Solirubrobacteraceae bacterium]|nr:helix-turn-helix domain-containing protein [Solirubrobacteraceae bacterium]